MSNWPIVALNEVFSIARGGSPRPIDAYLTNDPAGINWIMIGDACEGAKYIDRTKKRIRPEGAQRSRRVKPGDFLLTNSMSFGKPYIMRTSGCIHDGWLTLSPRRHEVDADFFYYLLGSEPMYAEFKRRASGATVKNLSIDLVKSIDVPLPPLPEQRRIAEVLDRAEGLRAKRRAALTQLDTLTQAVFLDMFGDPATNPKGWPRKHLGELSRNKPNNGIFRKNPEYVQQGQDGLPVVWVEDLFRGDSIDTADSRRVVPLRSEVEKYGLKTGDILFCRSSLKLDGIAFNNVYLGKDDDALFECHLIRLSPNASIASPVFLNSLLRLPQLRAIAKSKSKTATMTTIDQQALCSINVPLPPISLQHKFEQRAVGIQRQKETGRLSLSELNALFSSLQHRAFRGEL